MELKEYHPSKEMERVPSEDIPDRLDELLERMERENIGFVLTEAGQDSLVLCPYRWFKPETIPIEVQEKDVLPNDL